MKILLINPAPWYFAVPYSGYAILYDILKERGHEVHILELTQWRDFKRDLFDIRHANLMDQKELYDKYILPIIEDPIKNLASQLIHENWDVIGFTLNYLNIFNTNLLCKEIKGRAPEQLIIGGGYSCFSIDAATNISKHIDYYFIGDADETLPVFLEKLKNHENLNNIPGVLNYKYKDNFKYAKPPNPSLVPVPSYKGFNQSSYSLNRPRISIIGSRGCPWAKCNFCVSPQMKFRKRDRNHILQEIRYHLSRGMKDIIFNDPSFPSDDEDLQFIDDLIKIRREFGIDYGIEGQCRISSLLSPDVARKLKKAGFGLMMFGYESGSNRLLVIMNKGITRDEILECVKNCKAGGLNVSGYFLVGHFKETHKDFLQTASLVIEMSPYVAQLEDVNTYMFQLGTNDYKEAINNPEIHLHKVPFGGSINIFNWYSKNNTVKIRRARTRFIEILIRLIGKLPEWRQYPPGSKKKLFIYSHCIIWAERLIAKRLSDFISFLMNHKCEFLVLIFINFIYFFINLLIFLKKIIRKGYFIFFKTGKKYVRKLLS